MKVDTMRLLRISLWLNLGMVLFGALLFPYLSLRLAMMPSIRVTDLDRNSVFDGSALRQHYPSLAANVRGNLGTWIAEGPIAVAKGILLVGMVAIASNALLNVILLYRFRDLSERSPKSSYQSEH